MRWRDVERVRVRNAWVRYEHTGEGKSDLSIKRSVAVTDRLIGELKRWRQRRLVIESGRHPVAPVGDRARPREPR